MLIETKGSKVDYLFLRFYFKKIKLGQCKLIIFQSLVFFQILSEVVD